MKRMHLKKRKIKKNIIINKIILIIILLVIAIIYLLKLFNERAIPQFISYSEVQTERIVSLIINNTISEEVANNIDMDDLFITTKNSEGDIKSIDFNTISVNTLLSKTEKMLEKNLIAVEKGDIDSLGILANTWDGYDETNLKKGIIYELPSGIIFNNTILNNVLPKIPVKIDLIGNIFCKLTTDINSYGINNALIKIGIEVDVDVKILLPFVSETIKVSSNIPIIIKLIEGNIPEYYFNGYLDTPTITSNIE
ncbi:MAG: sporulation protein YunB [Bacilli bacterium]|nr:sporulation protein YunB [Bacilli bacterium]